MAQLSFQTLFGVQALSETIFSRLQSVGSNATNGSRHEVDGSTMKRMTRSVVGALKSPRERRSRAKTGLTQFENSTFVFEHF